KVWGYVEQVELGTELDLSLEAGRPVGAGVQALQRIGPRARDHVCGNRGGGALAVERAHDAPGAVRIVECEPTLEAGADDRHVAAARARRAHHGRQVEER